MNRLLRILFVAAVALLATASCSGSSMASGVMRANNLDKERAAEAARLTWPPGVAVPTFPPAPAEQYGKGVRYDVGLGASEADQAWFCAWSKEWLDTRSSDSTRAASALEQLGQITSMPIWPFLGGGQQDLTDALDKAELGDPSQIVVWRQGFECQG